VPRFSLGTQPDLTGGGGTENPAAPGRFGHRGVLVMTKVNIDAMLKAAEAIAGK
jgi:hypothetical protein